MRPGAGTQDARDFVACVARQAGALLGEEAAARAANTLARFPAVLTANHHGVDTFAQSLQGTLALGLGVRRLSPADASAVVVLACAAIPLNNLTYPRGLLGYSRGATGRVPVRLPVFPDRYKRDLVHTCAAFDAGMVTRAAGRAEGLGRDGSLHPASAAAARALLEEDYARDAVLSLPGYSQQATVLNAALWRRQFRTPASMPALVYLDLEAVAGELLAGDLEREGSLAHAVFLDPAVRRAVVTGLDGARACWNRRSLASRAAGEGGGPAGSVLLWGLDRRGRRVPLDLLENPRGPARLVGVSDGGEPVDIPLEPSELIQALKDRRAMPTLFASYLCILMARNVNCLGGYYQADYLPRMQRAVVSALRARDTADELAAGVAGCDGATYLSGMQAVLTRNPEGGLDPAGPLEIAAAGGLDEEALDRVATTTLDDGHLGSTVDTVLDTAADLVGHEGWQRDIATDLAHTLPGAVVMEDHG